MGKVESFELNPVHGGGIRPAAADPVRPSPPGAATPQRTPTKINKR